MAEQDFSGGVFRVNFQNCRIKLADLGANGLFCANSAGEAKLGLAASTRLCLARARKFGPCSRALRNLVSSAQNPFGIWLHLSGDASLCPPACASRPFGAPVLGFAYLDSLRSSRRVLLTCTNWARTRMSPGGDLVRARGERAKWVGFGRIWQNRLKQPICTGNSNILL